MGQTLYVEVVTEEHEVSCGDESEFTFTVLSRREGQWFESALAFLRLQNTAVATANGMEPPFD